jgi:hypothetical protein
MKIQTLLAIVCTTCFCAAADNFEIAPTIPEKADKHKSIGDLIPKDSIQRIISLMSSDATEPVLDQSIALTSKNYRHKSNQVIPSLYASNKNYSSQYNINGNVMTNDLLVITKDKLWRIQVYENDNIGGIPIACVVTDGLARYDFMLPFINN